MTREELLKTLELSESDVQMPELTSNACTHFHFDRLYGDWKFVEQGDSLSVINPGDKSELAEKIKFFDMQIHENIPLTHRDKIDWMIRQPDRALLRPGAIGWKYTPSRSELDRK